MDIATCHNNLQADFGLARTFGSPDRRYTNQVSGRPQTRPTGSWEW